MQDHEFEKQVHDKMEELRVGPSDTVWVQVQRRLHQKERRRRFLWLPLFFAALMVGGYLSFRFFSLPMPGNQLRTGPISGRPASPAVWPVAQKKPANHKPVPTEHLPPLQNDQTYSITPTTPIVVAAPLPLTGKPARQVVKPSAVPALTAEIPFSKTASVPKDRGFIMAERNAMQTTRGSMPERNMLEAPVKANSGIVSSFPSPPPEPVAEKEPTAAKPFFSFAARTPVEIIPGLKNGLAAIPEIRLPAKRKMEWGIALQGGATMINSGQLNTLFSDRAAGYMYSPTVTNLGMLNGNITPAPSKIEPGLGFSAGVFVRRKQWPRLTVSAGIRYTLFSTSIRVGTSVDSLRQATPDKSVNSFYRLASGQQYIPYINRYHFVELPLALEMRLNGQRRLPLIWEAGVSLSYLVSSNALHYSSALSGYYKDNGQFNRTQLSLFTGLQAQIFSGTAHPLRFGPQIRYGFTRLLPPAGTSMHHLLQYGGGISMVVW